MAQKGFSFLINDFTAKNASSQCFHIFWTVTRPLAYDRKMLTKMNGAQRSRTFSKAKHLVVGGVNLWILFIYATYLVFMKHQFCTRYVPIIDCPDSWPRFSSWVWKICWRRDRLPTPVFSGFPCGSAGKEAACNAGDLGLIPGLGRSPGEGDGHPLQHSGLENSVDWMGWRRVRHDWVTFTFTFTCQILFGENRQMPF